MVQSANQPSSDQLREDLIRTLESVNSYSHYVAKLTEPGTGLTSEINHDQDDFSPDKEGVDPFSEQHNEQIAMKLATLEKRWLRLSNDIQNNVTLKTAACCEEMFRGAFDIGLLVLFARRVGLPMQDETFVTKFTDELHSIKELYDKAISRTTVNCETVINRYNDLCEREVQRLNWLFTSVTAETNQEHKDLTEKRCVSVGKMDTILSEMSVLHFDPQSVHNLRLAYDELTRLTDQEIRSLNGQLKSRCLENATLEQNLDEALEEIDILRSQNALLEDQMNAEIVKN